MSNSITFGSMVGGVESVAAAGTTNVTAATLPGCFNRVTSSTAGSATGVILPSTFPLYSQLYVINETANAITVYPPVGHQLNGTAVNVGVAVPANGCKKFMNHTAVLWAAM
jgi:hypothetical protein